VIVFPTVPKEIHALRTLVVRVSNVPDRNNAATASDSGFVRRTLNESLAQGEEPTRTAFPRHLATPLIPCRSGARRLGSTVSATFLKRRPRMGQMRLNDMVSEIITDVISGKANPLINPEVSV